MAVRTAEAVWQGSLQEGQGSIKLGSGAFEGAYSFSTRFEDAPGTNPEELLGAAHAGCYSMALGAGLGRTGFTPTSIQTTAKVHMIKGDEGLYISKIDLVCVADVPDLDEETFMEQANAAKSGCIISRALNVPEITLDATLKS